LPKLTILEEYWAAHDESGEYPNELHTALSKDGWIGIALPEELGGAGLGISEATMMLQTISEYDLYTPSFYNF
jgi:acyl-CoA dehydrogenase